jgi:hypothetical protein
VWNFLTAGAPRGFEEAPSNKIIQSFVQLNYSTFTIKGSWKYDDDDDDNNNNDDDDDDNNNNNNGLQFLQENRIVWYFSGSMSYLMYIYTFCCDILRI